MRQQVNNLPSGSMYVKYKYLIIYPNIATDYILIAQRPCLHSAILYNILIHNDGLLVLNGTLVINTYNIHKYLVILDKTLSVR